MQFNFFQEKGPSNQSALKLAGGFCSLLLSLAARKEGLLLMLVGKAAADCTWGCWVINGTPICGMQCT